MGWLTCSYQLLCLQLVVLHSVSCANLCSHDQSSALLHFKQLFSFQMGWSYKCNSSYPKMEYWKEDTDCCLWDGVTCDTVTGHVIGLDLSCSWLSGTIPSNSSLFLLSHLKKLNLAFNDFSYSQIPSDFVRLKSLTHLNLSFSSFSGPIPLEISHLSKLVSLDLSFGFGHLTLETSVMKGVVQNMTVLEKLVLSFVNMSTIDPAYLTNLSSSLTLLDLQRCGLQGMFPENIFHLPNLHTLALMRNKQLTGTFPKVNWSSPLRYLDVSYTQFLGELPYSIGNLKSLVYLNMGYCSFLGSLPTSIGNLTQLSELYLGGNNLFGDIPYSLSNLVHLENLYLHENEFEGEIPDIFSNLTQISHLKLSMNRLSGSIPSTVENGLRNLTYIALDDNSLNGTIPSWLFCLQLLEYMDLSNNHLSGPIAEFPKTSLQVIHLSNNRLHGPIPHSIFELESLTDLILHSNKLNGTVELYMFAKLKNLTWLDLSYNNISLSTSIKINSFFPQLQALHLSSCNIHEFPKVLSSVGSLWSLDLSNNKIHGEIPNWLSNIDIQYSLNISHNFLRGIDRLPWFYIRILDLHSNLIEGPLPALPPSLIMFSASHNKLVGVMPSSFCRLSSIEYLDLSNNGLYGMIPQCLGSLIALQVLDLKRNNFNGSILQPFEKGNQLKTLNLNGNQLEGQLPPSLVNCGNLEVIDLGNNMINDTFPHWLAILPQLQVLILRSNRFHGSLGNLKTRLLFPKLRILDLSHNGFTGYLRMKFFESFQAMMNGKNNSVELTYMGDDYYQDSVIVTMKGVETTMERILNIFTTMDLSSNKFRGQIPDIVGKLNSLKVLNFSHNNLTGYVPISLENLTELESLDLSSNKLHGEIPMQLTSLTSLSVLNLSYNQLEGLIPSGKQFNTFENNSYIGNLGLCGLPLSKKCSSDDTPELESPKSKKEQDNPTWFDWKIILMGYGSGLVIGLSMGYIIFSTRKPQWFVSMVERKVLKLTERCRRGRRRN